jgi:hypothetical protein
MSVSAVKVLVMIRPPLLTTKDCQMLDFHTKSPDLVTYILEWKMFVMFYVLLDYFTDIWNMLWPFGIFCVHFAYFTLLWYAAAIKIWQPWKQFI